MSDLLQLKEVLEEKINSASKVFISGHQDPDFDSLASSLGVDTLCKMLNKESYIILEEYNIQSNLLRIKNDIETKFNFINPKMINNKIDNNSLLIMIDVNKEGLLPIKEPHLFKNIVIIDHHKTDKNTINADYKYIDLNSSSTSEIITDILDKYNSSLFNKEVSNLLLAGIVLDTNRFSKNTSSKTIDIVKNLISKGADINYVNNLFLREFESDKKISNLVFYGTSFITFKKETIQNKKIAFVLNREKPKTVYRKEEIAIAADKLLKYKVDASFALGYINNSTISISARSKSDIDVADIMSDLETIQGGGNKYSAGGKSNKKDLFETEKELIKGVEKYLKK